MMIQPYNNKERSFGITGKQAPKVSCIVLLLICLATLQGQSQTYIENPVYRIRPAADFETSPAFIIEHKASHTQRRLTPTLQLIYAALQPKITSTLMDGQPGIVQWETAQGSTTDIGELGSEQRVASSYRVGKNQIEFLFKPTPRANVSLVVKLLPQQTEPILTMSMTARMPGHYSLGFTGMPKIDTSDIDFVYQPLTWTWKRFPTKFALTEEAFANTAAVFTNHHHITEGLAVSPAAIPYRYALSAQWNNSGDPKNAFWSVFPSNGPKGNSLFGMAIRNPEGKAQPRIYAPLPGTMPSAMQQGQNYRCSLVYFLYPGNWQDGVARLLPSVFKYKNERENATTSLNGTINNMLQFAMNDLYSGWNAELKASNYQFDVPGTVKNVSALHPLSIALVTGDPDILKRRAIPMIEYVMSREKFLYTTSDTPHQAQAPSRLLNGPCVDIGELAGLNELTHHQTPAFIQEASRIFGVSRKLNMNTETGGGSWQDYLARFRMLHDSGDLKKAVQGANAYLALVYDQYSHTFFDSPGLRDKGAGFTTDYGLRIYDLLELYEQTKIARYLQAATAGAQQFLLWTRSTPLPPAGNIIVNKGGSVPGIFPGRRTSGIEGAGFVPMNVVSDVKQEMIPAWRTSLNGLVPEAPNTYAFGPVMLAHHAAWLLRLAKYTGDTLLRNAAYNSVIGRYANFPGYYFTSLHTNVYQQAGYSNHPYEQVKYNAIFYNHVWPHLALLFDFLVSDFYYRSKGAIDFPATYAPGYAFLTSNVYGAKTGEMMGHKNIRLWMPRNALQSDGIACNYLMGYNKEGLFIAFANTSKTSIKETFQLNSEVIAYNRQHRYAILRQGSQTKQTSIMKDGKFMITVPANGLVCIQIAGLGKDPGTLHSNQPVPQNRFIRYAAVSDSQAKATAMIIQPTNQVAVFYLYSNQTEKNWRQCRLRYRINNEQNWISKTDYSYPFEFDVELPRVSDVISFELTGTDQKGNAVTFPVQQINKP
ncbi:hypothetical protein [Niabella drilacis]|uniref:Uncharacterized protein n=1 Tax=Niabella drilacis (strain DSM 25811 / CCM 8410 / CCUG 62505 / LMG 26954 / E90) TaxID=1285928 RepID=A0A1G6XJ21_NIADE|nr:hypothetical protein [Niabella drilacis]SDD78244.1 hypothetical protein SAMN04487894_11397 [Niabella drilacis]